MPLTLTNNLTSFKNKKRSHVILNEPFAGASTVDSWTGVATSSIEHSGGAGYIVITSASSAGYGYMSFITSPNSTYIYTATMTAIVGGVSGDATLKIGTSHGDNSIVNKAFTRSGATHTDSFTVGNTVKEIFVSLQTDAGSQAAYWDAIQIIESG